MGDNGSVTFPRTVGQVPIYYDMKNTGRPYTPDKQGQKYLSRYLNTPNSPLYAFGQTCPTQGWINSPGGASSWQALPDR